MNESQELIAKLGRANTFLLLRVMQTFNGLRDLLLEYREYAPAFSDAITDALNRRIITTEPFCREGNFASVFYTADAENKTCSMEFVGECNGRLYLRFVFGETENNEAFEFVLEEGVPLDFIHSMLEALWVSHSNLYEQLMAVKEGYGYFTVEPKKPN